MPYTHKPRMIWIKFHLKWNWFHAEGNTLISYYISWNSFCMKIKTEEQKKWEKKREQKSKGTLFVISMSILFMFYTNCKVQRLWNSKLMNWNLRCTSSARVQRITPLIWFQFPFASDLTADSFCCHCHSVCSRDCWDETIFAAHMQCRQKVFFSTSVCSLYLTLDVCSPGFFAFSLYLLLSNSTSMYLSTSFSSTVSPPVSFKMQKKTIQANKEMSKSIEFGHTTFTPFYQNEFRLFANFHSEHIFLQFF